MDYALDIILNERLYCPEYSKLNDPFEGLFNRLLPGSFGSGFSNGFSTSNKTISNVDELLADSRHTRVCSLSSDLNDVRLWSHYADSHRGIAIELDFTNHVDDVSEVKYKKELPTMLGGLFELGTSPKDILTIKTDHWEHESEYRIIHNTQSYYAIDMVKAIYCGIDISDMHKNTLLNIALAFHIDMYETTIDTEELKITVGKKLSEL